MWEGRRVCRWLGGGCDSPACGQVCAAVALDDVAAKAVQAVHAHLHVGRGIGQGTAFEGVVAFGAATKGIQAVHAHHQLRPGEWAGEQQCSILSCPGRTAVHAHHQLRPAKRVGRLVRDVEREVPHQQLVVT